MMFARKETLLDDLRAFAADPTKAIIPFSFASSEAGAGLLQLAAGRTPASLESREPGAIAFESAQRFLACVVFDPKNNYFTLLCVDRNASDDAIKDNYRRLIALVHPDANPIGFPSDAASRVNLGYAVLSNAEARASYAESLDRIHVASTFVAKKHQNDVNGAHGEFKTLRASPRRGLFARIKRPRFGFGLLALAAILILPVVLILGNMANDPYGERLTSGVLERPEKKQTELSDEGATGISTSSPNSFEVSNVAALAENNASLMRPKSANRTDSAVRTNSVILGATERTEVQRNAPAQGAVLLSDEAPSPAPRTAFATSQTSMKLSLAPVPSRLLDQAEPATAVSETRSPRVIAPQTTTPVLAEPIPHTSSGAPATIQSAVKAQPSAVAQNQSTTAPRVLDVRTRDSEDALLRFGSAYEQGAIDGVRALFAAAMPGRSQMIADYQRVFSNTRQRNIRFLQLKHTVAGQRVTTVGQAVVNTVGADNKSSSQRVFLEIEVVRDGNDVRIERMSNYALD